MINFNREYPTKELIYNHISDYDIFNNYIDKLVLGKRLHSPLRQDNNPSFAVFHSDKYNKLFYRDFSTSETGDGIVFIQRLFNLNLQEALSRLVEDFRLTDKFFVTHNSITPKLSTPTITNSTPKKQHSTVNIKMRKWELYDLEFWNQFGITLKTLHKFKVVPISHFFIGEYSFKSHKYSYAYVEFKDGETRFKVYQPEGSKIDKWYGSFVYGTLSGYTQLPETGDLLIVTSSLKDGMCLYEFGYTFVAPQTEGFKYKPSVMEELLGRFKKVIVFYDNDTAGIKASEELYNIYGIESIFTIGKYKDISDYYKNLGKTATSELLNKLIPIC